MICPDSVSFPRQLKEPELAEVERAHVTANPVASGAAIFEAGTQPCCPVGPGGQQGRWLPGLKMATVPTSQPSGWSASPRGSEPDRAPRAASLRVQPWGRGCSGPTGAGSPPSSGRSQSARGASSPRAARARGV